MTTGDRVPAPDPARTLRLAVQTLDVEASAVEGLKARLDGRFVDAVRMILRCTGRVVVMGMGKSGHVGRKIAATLSSTGTPAMFVHPGEASHGDLGMITGDDVVIAISNSGESDELNVVVPVLKRLGVRLIAMTGRIGSTLAQHADVVLDSAVDVEACPLNLAPTSSTTAQMALGDALAVVLLDARGFSPEDFARSHPGGALGRRLLVHVADLLSPATAAARVGPDQALGDVLRAMSRSGMGIAAVVDDEEQVIGVFTDGDLRRLIEGGEDVRRLVARDVMRGAPRLIARDAIAANAAAVMETGKINTLIVVDSQGHFVGTLDTNTLMRAKVI